ncbi:MAG: PBP1A family penicillin-binding protein [Firmicutes bacterium]|nr:PBP1A family penicillin-binding protein [Bacillota bacterium]
MRKTRRPKSTGGNSPGKRKKSRKVFKVFKIILLLLFIALIVLGAGAFSVVYSYIKEAPEFDSSTLHPPVTSYIYDCQGKEIAELYDEQNRIEVPLERIPRHVQKAFIAIEDERFEEHFGVDPVAIMRAFMANLRQRRWASQGGSTITQQLIKDAFLTPEKSYRRKIQEAWLAIKMEQEYSKDEILEMYLNRIFFAHGAYGIEAAANTYFNKSVEELTIAEAALLAGIPRAPSYYSPYHNFENSRQRQKLVLAKMYELGYITHRELIKAQEQEIILSEQQSREYPYPYFVDYVLHHELVNTLVSLPEYNDRKEAYEAIYNMGLKIYTTLDVEAQTITEDVLNDESLYSNNIRVDMALMKQLLENNNYNSYPEEVFSEEGILQPQAAAVVANPKTGEILALVGGREYSKKNQDLRFISTRQPGSSIKPIVAYAPSFEENLLTPGSIIDDSPYIKGSWAPENFNRRFLGLTTVRNAIVPSQNIPAVKAFEKLTPHVGLEYAKKMGLSTIHDNDYNLATTLGGLTYGVTPLDMAQAFSVLANQGIKVNLHTIKRIEDRNGSIIYEYQSEPEAVLSQETAFLITDILKDVVRRGTAGRLRVGRPVAAKTGTTDDNRDAYLVAYTPDIVISFWLGHDITKLGRVSGGSATTINYMNALLLQILEDVPPSDFERPSGISGPISICSKSGLRPGPFCPDECITSEIFPSGMVPQKTCDLHIELEICTTSGLLAGEFCPESEIEKRVFLNRPEFIVTDGRWRGAGRGPEDAALMPPEEHCDVHSSSASGPAGFIAYLLENPLRAYLQWDYNPEIVEYDIYKCIEGEEELDLLQRLPGSIAQYLDNDIKPGHTYIYTLIATDSQGIKSEPMVWMLQVPLHNGQGDDHNGNDNDNDNLHSGDNNGNNSNNGNGNGNGNNTGNQEGPMPET